MVNTVNQKMFDRISVVKNLDKDLAIKRAGSDFYAIGLSLFPYISSKRKSIYNPYFVSVITIGYTLKLAIGLFLEANDDAFFLITGDWSYFIGARYHMTVSALTYGVLASVSQLIHFWYFWKGIEPSYLEPFKVIAGQLCPIKIGLIDKQDVVRLVMRAKIYFMLTKAILLSRIPVALLLSAIPMGLNIRSPLDLLVVVPWVFIFTVWVYLTAGFLVYHILYFSILCYYLKLKIKRLNAKILEAIGSTKAMTARDIKILVKHFHWIHNEIQQINDNHWSLYLLLVTVACMVIWNMCNYIFFFAIQNQVLKIIFFYLSVLFLAFLLFVLMTASSVVIESNRTYPILNYLYGKQNNLIKSTVNKLKVF